MQSTALVFMSCENAISKKPILPQVPVYDDVIFCDLGFELYNIIAKQKGVIFMTQKMISFPGNSEFHTDCEHVLQEGGMSMKVKNTHPDYKSEEARIGQLKDTQKSCLSLLRALRNAPAKVHEGNHDEN